MLIIELLILMCLGLICYQDLKFRAVYWIYFPVLTGLLFFLKQDDAGTAAALKDAAIAIVFFGSQLLLIWIYFSIKNKKPVNMTNGYLGLGDILFLLSVAFYLSPVNYVLFYVGSLIVVLVYVMAVNLFKQKANPEIPLAGLQALMLGCLLILSITSPDIKLYTDAWTYGL